MSLTPAKSAPQRVVLDGRYVRLEPIEDRHAADLYAVSSLPGGPERYRWLFSDAPASLAEMKARIEQVNAGADRFVAIIDKSSGKAVGQQAWMRIRPEHGSIEIGGVYWGLPMSRTRMATEALYLFARHAFDDLGYRRFEWKCNVRNEPSKAAATRFGFVFEGIFRQDMILKGESRDTAWFSILDGEWPALRAEYERWLSPENFDAAGQQKTKLAIRQ
ncbi:GNAT family protein [Devosia sp. 63-57]|uniref:GNAT family N-acetyltransferase n=1 Tax=Devosia sp. 63-57 TaxID=1895751 RepID=UPI00086A17EE|nr:GNAT family protein [Devosia sp. 63-57]ODT48845.1 MAG: GNAT family N-acetyltransferase [Pelagibacterium sp. SCN 63-126]ODU86866.1 MAG: GNAT family N-acetyltransferase [Pelagibacterium sp. SCN 63-17]OJX44227.1 MAG: GNAT family N-acetyltransferase [Devosia sp. 63-57]